MSDIYGFVVFTVKDGTAEAAEEAFSQMVTASQGHEGCVTYALHRAVDDQNTYVLFERWKSQDELDRHQKHADMAAVGPKLAKVLAAPPALTFVTPVPLGDPTKGML